MLYIGQEFEKKKKEKKKKKTFSQNFAYCLSLNSFRTYGLTQCPYMIMYMICKIIKKSPTLQQTALLTNKPRVDYPG